MKKLLYCVFAVLASIQIQGCSVGMAMSGKENPQLGAIKVGASRGEIEMHLGSPVKISEVNGKRVDVYEYEIGNEPSAGRALGHGVMDVLTLGLWEVIGTPIEGFQGDKRRITITYDANNVVTKIGN